MSNATRESLGRGKRSAWIGTVVAAVTVLPSFQLNNAEAVVAAKVESGRRSDSLQDLRRDFANPPMKSRPWVCWFWWDCVLSQDELERELQDLHDAGFGGAEIRCATFYGWSGDPLPMMDDASLEQLDQKKYDYLSDEFVELLAFTCQKAKELGLRLSVNLGQGWPPGGPWIPDEHRTKHIAWESKEFNGPTTFDSKTVLPAGSMAGAWKLSEGPGSKQVLPDSFVDLSPGKSGGKVRWDVPNGKWLIGLFRVEKGGICDKGDGPEVDPASRDAVRHHLDHFFGRIDEKLSPFYGSTLVDVATDSWEYQRGGDRYWSPAIPVAYHAKMGVSFATQMYALLGYGPNAQETLDTLERVEQELVHENFYGTIANYTHQRGLGHRPQIYGRGLARDLLEAYTLVDTPELEHSIMLPEAVWAARTTGLPNISCEAFTFVTTKPGEVGVHGGFHDTTPALLRWHANHVYSEGVNRIDYHSYGYSPPGVPAPGWRMYAEVQLGKLLPWWPQARRLNDWMARCQVLLQAGRPVPEVFVYPVRSNPNEEPYCELGDSQPASAINAVDAGNQYTLDKVARLAKSGAYQPLAVCVLEPPLTIAEASNLLTILGGNGLLVCRAKDPLDWRCLKLKDDDLPSDEADQVRRRIKTLQRQDRIKVSQQHSWHELASLLQTVQWLPDTAQLAYQHRQIAGEDFYFLVNRGAAFRGKVSLPRTPGKLLIWDADTGGVTAAGALRHDKRRTTIPIELDRFESTFISTSDGPRPVTVTQSQGGSFGFDERGELVARFERPGKHRVDLSNGEKKTLNFEETEEVAIRGPWRLMMERSVVAKDEPPQPQIIQSLTPWRELAGFDRLAGVVSYETTFSLSESQLADGLEWRLRLGEVHEVADVHLNGQPLGVAWRPPFSIDATYALRVGKNRLHIEVANLLNNHLKSASEYSRPSGLLGPVRLVPVYRAAITSTSP